MRIVHKAGDKLFINFTGKRLNIVDSDSGEVQELEVFVAILGYSQLTFVTAVPSQKKEDFILACKQALHFFGGVPNSMIVLQRLQLITTRMFFLQGYTNPKTKRW